MEKFQGINNVCEDETRSWSQHVDARITGDLATILPPLDLIRVNVFTGMQQPTSAFELIL